MYNVNHGFDMDERSIQKRIDAWQKSQAHGEKIRESIEKNGDTFFQDEKAYNKWKNTSPDIKGVNRAREKMISGMTQFLDGLADLKELSGTWITDPDYMNLVVMTAFSKSTFYEKTLHWAKAEEKYQKERNTGLPGGYSGNGQEEIVRDHDGQWFSLQFLYRQFEFMRFVPNYDIVAGIWALNNGPSHLSSQLLDHWFYIHSEQIKTKVDLTDFTKGYFFRYNANMTTEAQAQTLYILTNLFRYSMSQPMGTLEHPPWFRDSTITGNTDGNLSHSKNIIPHRINLVDMERLQTAPIVQQGGNGMMTIPTESEKCEDKKLAGKVVDGKPKKLAQVEDEIDEVEEKRDGLYKSKWDGEKILTFDEGRVWVSDGVVTKIKTEDGRVEKLRVGDVKYRVGSEVPE